MNQADVRAGNVWEDIGQCSKVPREPGCKMAEARPHRGCCQGHGHGATVGAARVMVAVQHRPRPWTLVPASADMSPLTLAVPPGPAQLCHTPGDPALELLKVALAGGSDRALF